MASKLILLGTETCKFYPYNQVTHVEFAAIIVRALGLLPEAPIGQFKDVDSEAWYAGEVQAAFQASIVSGRTLGNPSSSSHDDHQDAAHFEFCQLTFLASIKKNGRCKIYYKLPVLIFKLLRYMFVLFCNSTSDENKGFFLLYSLKNGYSINNEAKYDIPTTTTNNVV